MLEQVGSPISFYAHFIDATNRTSLTGQATSVRVDVYKCAKDETSPNLVRIVTNAVVEELGDDDSGVYRYTLDAAEVDEEGEYVAVFKANLTAFFKHIMSTCVVGRGIHVLGKEFADLQVLPGGTPTMEEAIMMLYNMVRKKSTTSSTALVVHNDSGGTKFATSTLSDDGTLFTRGKMV